MDFPYRQSNLVEALPLNNGFYNNTENGIFNGNLRSCRQDNILPDFVLPRDFRQNNQQLVDVPGGNCSPRHFNLDNIPQEFRQPAGFQQGIQQLPEVPDETHSPRSPRSRSRGNSRGTVSFSPLRVSRGNSLQRSPTKSPPKSPQKSPPKPFRENSQGPGNNQCGFSSSIYLDVNNKENIPIECSNPFEGPVHENIREINKETIQGNINGENQVVPANPLCLQKENHNTVQHSELASSSEDGKCLTQIHHELSDDKKGKKLVAVLYYEGGTPPAQNYILDSIAFYDRSKYILVEGPETLQGLLFKKENLINVLISAVNAFKDDLSILDNQLVLNIKPQLRYSVGVEETM